MKFTGIFNYQRQVHSLETEADTKRQAWKFFCFGLAKQHGVRAGVMTNYFNGEKLNFEIKEEKPWNTK